MAPRNKKPFRENSHLPAKGWSTWKRAMVPSRTKGPNLEPRSEPGSEHVGKMRSGIKYTFGYKATRCGIYEWQARRNDQPNRVVYIGSTCGSNEGALRTRILEYCTNGSHKAKRINKALKRGYELWVRVKVARGSQPRERAERMENDLLDKYDYMWNITRNKGPKRYLPAKRYNRS